jgi:hypothetical protein
MLLVATPGPRGTFWKTWYRLVALSSSSAPGRPVGRGVPPPRRAAAPLCCVGRGHFVRV